jgi:BASS family bile acid:Na+ symporter
VSSAALALLLVASMLAVGTTLSTADFRALADRPVVPALAVLVNVVVVPGLAVLLARLAGVGSDATLGIVLAAAAPGGGTGALLTLHARGDLAVGAALQGVYAPLGLLSVPLWAWVAGYDLVPAGLGGVVLVVGGLLGQVVPVAVGMLLRRRRPAMAQRVHRMSRRVADVLLAALVLYFLVTGVTRLPEVGWTAAGVIGAVVLACLSLVLLPVFDPPSARRAVAMTTAVRNLSLALFVADAAGPVVVLTLLAYGLLMYGLSVPAALLLARTAAPVS